MLKLLVKKQLQEVFRSYFNNSKKNAKRSKAAVILFFCLFAFLMIGVMGGMFGFLSYVMCRPFADAGMDWLFFLLMSGMAVLFGAFGSVFNTFAGLYLAKDNDLLLSMPIPVKYIIASRILNVYLMGTMYSAVVILPALIVYAITVGVTFASVLGGLLLMISISFIVLVLSCLLGWCVAKLSLKLKNKSFFTVLISLLFIGAYYFFYFKAQVLVQDLIANAAVYGTKIKGAAYGLYCFGTVGTGNLAAAAVCTLICVALLALTWLVLKNTFLSIATATGKTTKVKYTEKRVKEKSMFGALFSKELSHFTASPTYMLNCGISTILIPVGAVALLIKGPDLLVALQSAFPGSSGETSIIVCAMLCMLGSMNFIAAPSVSLEGKSLWLCQSLPVKPALVLRAKAALHLLITGIPMVFAVICCAIVLNAPVADTILICAVPLAFTVLSAVFDTFIGLKMANLNWTSEIVPIKQGGAVAIAMFGGWAAVGAFAGLYFLIGFEIGFAAYMLIWLAVLAVSSVLIMRWLDTKGAEKLARL